MAVALVGPTASGKSDIALAVARALPGPGGVELVSIDSMAVYRGLDIGTAKPSAAVRAEVPYHLLDLVDPDEDFSVTRFQEAAVGVLEGIAARGGKALLVGGTGLYLRAITDGLTFPGRYPAVAAGLVAELDGLGTDGSLQRSAGRADLLRRLRQLDPVAASRIEPGNERRLVRALEVTIGSGHPFSSFGPGLDRYPHSPITLLGIHRDGDEADRRIGERFARLMDEGLLDEVRALAARPAGLSRTARQALGYRELLTHVEDGVPLDEAVDEAVRRTRAFAKRQRAWFRRDPRIEWIDVEADPVTTVLEHLEKVGREHGGTGVGAPRSGPVRDCGGSP